MDGCMPSIHFPFAQPWTVSETGRSFLCSPGDDRDASTDLLYPFYLKRHEPAIAVASGKKMATACHFKFLILRGLVVYLVNPSCSVM